MRRIKRESAVADRATKELRSAILRGDLRPGSRLRQEELAGRLGVSRVPVRQALVALEREGLVLADRWQGTIVAPLNAALIRDLYQFRGGIERFVAETLAARADFDPRQSRELVVAGRAAASAGDLARLIELDLRFHAGLYDAVGNRVLSDVMRGQLAHIRRVMGATLTIAGYPRHVWDEHAAILDAIESHDAERAGTLALAHTTAASKTLVERLKEEGGGEQLAVDSAVAASHG